MEPDKSPKTRRGWKTLAFVFSPLGLAFLWCAFVDQESFGAFLLGVLFTIVFGVIALGAWLIRKRGRSPG
jgi:RsiW-degrading membrane proteinase PrsW (M82 family)